ncbi:MAG: hypothetical protein ACOH1Y_15870 [Propionicimonas sp.]
MSPFSSEPRHGIAWHPHTSGRTLRPDYKMETATMTDTTQTARANLSHVNSSSLLGRALQEAAEVRQGARAKVIGGILARDPGRAAEACRVGQSATVSQRRRVLAAAAASVAAEEARLFGVNLPYVHQDPAVEYARESRIEAVTAPLTTEAEAAAAMGQALRSREPLQAIALAGGIARHASRKGWDEVVQTWCQPGLGGGSRGGWPTAVSIRAARTLIANLQAERWPGMLADFPTVDEVAVSMSRPKRSA